MCVQIHDHLHSVCTYGYVPYYYVDAQVWEALQTRNHQESTVQVIKDVDGGDKYKDLKEFTSKGNNITLTVNTDGIQIFKSSSVSMWPIWIVINELPITMRYVATISISFLCKI